MGACEQNAATVVYIEDDPSNVALMEDLLSEMEGVRLVTAPNAELGLELVRSCAPRVVIMDMILPGMNGLDATKLLRRCLRGVMSR